MHIIYSFRTIVFRKKMWHFHFFRFLFYWCRNPYLYRIMKGYWISFDTINCVESLFFDVAIVGLTDKLELYYIN